MKHHDGLVMRAVFAAEVTMLGSYRSLMHVCVSLTNGPYRLGAKRLPAMSLSR